jgi:hypothetical protein
MLKFQCSVKGLRTAVQCVHSEHNQRRRPVIGNYSMCLVHQLRSQAVSLPILANVELADVCRGRVTYILCEPEGHECDQLCRSFCGYQDGEVIFVGYSCGFLARRAPRLT